MYLPERCTSNRPSLVLHEWISIQQTGKRYSKPKDDVCVCVVSEKI